MEKKEYFRPRLVAEASDTLYTFAVHVPIEFAADWHSRKEQKEHIAQTLRMIDASDFKQIEHHNYTEILFKYPYDQSNYQTLAENAIDQPLTHRFCLPESKQKYRTESWKIKKWFQQAAENAGVSDDVKIKVNDQNQIVVMASNLATYFKFWHHLPEHRRRKMTDHGKPPKAPAL